MRNDLAGNSVLQENEPCPAAPDSLSQYRHFVVAAVVYCLLMQCFFLIRFVPVALTGRADFRTFYTAGLMVRSGAAHRLYDYGFQEQIQDRLFSSKGLLPFVHPAYVSLVFVPLSFLGYRAAYCVFFFINLCLLWISAKLLRPSVPHLCALWSPLPFFLLLSFFPVTGALMQGQTSLMELALFCAAFYSLQKANPIRAGVFIGLAIVKIQVALPFALFFLLWRRWRFFAGFAGGAAAALMLSLWITGGSVFVSYWRSLLLSATRTAQAAPVHVSPTLVPNMSGLLLFLFGDSASAARLAFIASFLLVLWIASRRCSLPVAVIAAVLISPYLLLHNLTLLLLPISITLENALGHPHDRRFRAAAIGCLFLLLPPVYFSLMKWDRVNMLAIPLLALLFCLARGRETNMETAAC